MIPVYANEDYEEIVGQVSFNSNLDHWDGSNNTNGSPGRHSGLTRLKSGAYVLIHGTQWQGERDTAEIISAKRAIQEILESGNESLFDKYPDLKAVMDKEFDQEA